LDDDGLLDLIYNEIVLREERGDKPQLEEYVRRFPQHAEQLRWQFSVHEGLRECSFWKQGPGAAEPPGPLGAMPPAPPGNGPSTAAPPGRAPPPAGGAWDMPTRAGPPADDLPHAKTVKPPPGKTVHPGGDEPPLAPGAHASAGAGGELLPGYEVLG